MDKKNNFLVVKVLLVLGVVLVGCFFWIEFFREEPETIEIFSNSHPVTTTMVPVDKVDPKERFKYGSVGGEFSSGIPYWIWVVLPRIFPDLTAGPGGYKSFGLVWEEGHEMPVGFTKKVIGFPRVSNNCAICHVGTWQSTENEVPHVVVGSPANTNNLQSMLRFLTNCAKDSRFNADILLPEIERNTKLSFVEEQIYRFVLIPMTRSALLQKGNQLAWMNRPHWPDWGPGRDDSLNLAKYFLTTLPLDSTIGQTSFPSIWNLKAKNSPGLLWDWGGESPAEKTQLVDSALGVGAAPDPKNPIDMVDWYLGRKNWVIQRMEGMAAFLNDLQPPAYPFSVNGALLPKGKFIYQRDCASCHMVGAARTSKLIPLNEIGTDTNRIDVWSQAAADEVNASVQSIGVDRPKMTYQRGYVSPPLEGVWMRAPYLHNGSAPTLADLLTPPALRPKVFYRGFDLYDPVKVGFVVQGPRAKALGWKQDASEKGNGNQGHTYGTTLSAADKKALIEYLKTL